MFGLSNLREQKELTAADSDAQYVAHCQQGDTEAFAVLVERHQKKMLNIAYRMTGNYEEACDVVQEAFLAAFRAINKFKGEALFSTWLTRIVLNHAKNRLKQLQVAHGHCSSTAIDDTLAEKADHQENEPATVNPLDEQIKRERAQHVHKCISRLEDEFREVVILRDIQGYSYEEISAVLKLPEGTVKSRLFRARSILKDYLIYELGDDL